MSWISWKGLFAGVIVAAVVGCGGGETPKPSANGETGSGEATKLTGAVAIDGSSTVFPVTEAVAEEFNSQVSSDVQVTVGISGTGGGFKKFIRGEIDVADASRPILAEEIAACKENGIEFIEIPVCFDALTVAVNPANDWVENITIDELKKIWEPSAEGKITKWNQIRPEWPDEKLVLYGAGTDSGTFDYFTEAVNGKAKSCRSDFIPSEDDNTLVQGIVGEKYSMGFIPFAYYEPNKDKMKALKIDWKSDDELGAIEPSLETVIGGTYNPLSRPLFIYVSKKAAERPEVKKFVEFYLDNVAELSQEVKYMPLPDAAYTMAKDRFAALKTGSGFGGVPEVGLKIEELLAREPK